MRSITKNFRLGFGSFIDKKVMPFVDPRKEKQVIFWTLFNFHFCTRLFLKGITMFGRLVSFLLAIRMNQDDV